MSKVIRPRVGLDVDGCFADFTHGFTRLAAEMGLVPAPWHCWDQDVWNFASAGQEPTAPVVRFDDKPVWAELDNRYNWWMGLEPLVAPEEVWITNELIKVADVYFITSRGPTPGLSTEAQTAGWLRGIDVDVDKATVIACPTSMKGPLAAALRLGTFLDDHVDNLVGIDAHGVQAVARRWKYNDRWEGPWVHDVGSFIEARMEELA